MEAQLLQNVPLFRGLDTNFIEQIAAHAVRQQFPKDSILVYEGEQPDALFIIVSGKAKVFVSDEDGRELTLYTLGAGDFFGELALIDGAPRSATVSTTEKSIMLKITGSDFERYLYERPEVTLNMIRELSRRVRGVNEHVRDLALLDVYGRVARTILRLAKETDTGLVTDPITQQDIANMVGASREMVSRVLTNLRNDNYISISEKRIHILTPPPARR